MRRLIVPLLAALVAVVALQGAPSLAVEADEPHLILFWAEGCPYCEAEREFLSDLAERLPGLRIAEYEVGSSEANRALFVETMAGLGLQPEGVPTTIVEDRVWVGFEEQRAGEIEAALTALLAGEAAPEAPNDTVIDIPFFGDIDVGSHSLLLATLIIGFVDGFNPCSLWVLSMLLALTLHSGSRRRVLAVGTVFLVVTTAMYGLYVAGLYGVLSVIEYTGWIRVVVAAIALGIGIINVKDYFAYGAGPSLTIPEGRKPGILGSMRRVAIADRSLPPLLLSTGALAVGVSLLETPCTAGFPLLWTNMLAENEVGLAAAAALFAAYMLVFLIDELLIFGGAVTAMRVSKLTEERGRMLKLIGGGVMIAMAGTMLLAPELMESIGGVIVVFAFGVVIAGLAVGTSRFLLGGRRSRRTPAGRR